MLYKRVNPFTQMAVNTFDERYDSDLYTLKYHLVFRLRKIIRGLRLCLFLRIRPMSNVLRTASICL